MFSKTLRALMLPVLLGHLLPEEQARAEPFPESVATYDIAPGMFSGYPWLESYPTENLARELLPISSPASGSSGGAKEPESLEARLEELEKKYAELEGSQEDVVADLEEMVSQGHGDETMRLSGRIHSDIWTFPASSPGVNGFESGNNDIPPQDRIGFRRARLGVDGRTWENMVYKLEMEFAGGNDVEFRDIYMGFTDLPFLQTVLIGNQKRPYGLDHLNSSRFNIFIERPFVIEAFNQDARRLGIQSYGFSDDLAWNWRYGIFNQRLIQDEGNYASNHWQGQVAGRLANTMWWDELSDGRGYAHWAVSGTWADPNGNGDDDNFADSGINEARFQTRPEARTESRWLDTGVIDDAKHYSLLGVENVVNFGAFQFCGEYQTLWLDREDAGQLYFHGGYCYVSYFLTGEHMTWDREMGVLDRIEPFENFFLVDTASDGVQGGWGAWQVAARYSTLDLSDDNIQGGIGDSVTLGVNWYWNPYANLQFNYIYGNIYDNEVNAVNGIEYGDYQIAGVRFRIDY